MQLSSAMPQASVRQHVVAPPARPQRSYYAWCACALFATLFVEMMGSIAFVHCMLPQGLDHACMHIMLNVASGVFALVTLFGIAVSEHHRRSDSAQIEALRTLERESATGSRLIDHDTNTFTREYFDQTLLREIGRASISAKSFCLLQCALSTAGPGAERQALSSYLETTLAQILRSSLRASDVIARTEKGEFTVILPQLDEQLAAIPVERIRRAVDRWNRNSNVQYRMRVKFGLCEYDRTSQPEELLLRVSNRCQLDQHFFAGVRQDSAHAGVLAHTSPAEPRHIC
jgi:GGDEF domain-containing protein